MYVGTVTGNSMYPMLRSRRDTIVVRPCAGRLGRYDVALYKRGEKYVLHRVLEVRQDDYVIRGDNCLAKEYGITDGDVLGVLTAFHRDEHPVSLESIWYKLYVRIWCRAVPIRPIAVAVLKVRKRRNDRKRKEDSYSPDRRHGDMPGCSFSGRQGGK